MTGASLILDSLLALFLTTLLYRVSDMSLGEKHPKRVFVTRLIELEVRLSYYDRVKGTIPEALYTTGVMADEAPGPEYAYAAAGSFLNFFKFDILLPTLYMSTVTDHKYAAPAASLLRMMRTKASIPEVESELASFQKSLREESGLSEEVAESISRGMTLQTLLSVGSMSFSHFLNVLER